MIKFSNLFILILLSSSIYSQDGSKLFLRVQYSITALEDFNRKPSDDWIYLDLGNSSSVYYSYFNYIRDSTVQSQKKLGLTAFEIIENVRGMKRGGKDVIISSANNKTFYIHSVIAIKKYVTSESIEDIKWSVTKDTTTMLNYKCYKATAHFRGREWTAWFAPDIPLTYGPWKLNGLPGLILKAADSEGHYTFEAMAIGKIDKIFQISDYSEYRAIPKKEFDQLLFKFKTEPLLTLENRGIKIESGKDAHGRPIDIKQKLKTRYNPIERDDPK